MELRAFAERVIFAEDLAGKLEYPEEFSDDAPGVATFVEHPARPPRLAIAPARDARVPPIIGMPDRSQRARIVHAMANHELQAAELFAWALLAFPDAAPAFRRGMAAILVDEQRHCQMYIDCLQSLHCEFGDHPVTGHFWNRAPDIQTPLAFVCAMGLTFENANLDFAGEYAAAAAACGDEQLTAVLNEVHADEIRHVAFAWRWLIKWAPDPDVWKTFTAHLKPPLDPSRARGKTFDVASRRAAGLSEEFIDALSQVTAKRPSGRQR